MKTQPKFLVLALCLLLFGSTMAQDNKRFNDVDLNDLRKTIVNQLREDGLIKSKKNLIYLFLEDDGIKLNGEKLSDELSARYEKLLSPFDLGTGPYRTIYLAKDCTAVGDLTSGSFTGKSRGRLSIAEAQKSFQALE